MHDLIYGRRLRVSLQFRSKTKFLVESSYEGTLKHGDLNISRRPTVCIMSAYLLLMCPTTIVTFNF